jgi:hypothetical protein
MKSLVILLAVTAIVYAEQCLFYQCNDQLPAGVCSSKTLNNSNTIFQMKECDGEKVCDVRLKGDDKCEDSYKQKVAYPGEFCRNDSECIKGTCSKDKICTLNPGNTTCEDDTDCNPGLFCKASNCEKLKMFNESCSGEDKCHPSTVCNYSVCVKLGSGIIGQKASAPIACKSFYLEGGACQEGPKLTNHSEDGLACNEGYLCEYTKVDKSKYNDKCRCGRGAMGAQYCQPGRGDIDMQPVRILANNVFSTGIMQILCRIRKNAATSPRDFSQPLSAAVIGILTLLKLISPT